MFQSLLDPETLPIIWFVLIGLLLAGYCILDGFDLGVGILHPLVARNDIERRLSINSIGPLWDGNEVWLVTLGGALFAMFPYAYATIFSSFYTAFMLLLFSLIFRAVSMEFRGKMRSRWATRSWDYGFAIGSFGASFLFGVAGGNMIGGLPLNERGEYTGTILDQLQPYPLVTGCFVVALFATHGGIFLQMKLEGDYLERIASATQIGWTMMLILYAIVSAWTLLRIPRAISNFSDLPSLWLIPFVNLALVIATGVFVFRRRPFLAFLCNAASIVSLVVLLATALFPNMVNAANPSADLRIADAASSPLTLKIGLLVVAIGLPFVITYTSVIYWTFRGKTELSKHSY